MTEENARLLEKLLDSGYLILITDHSFVDGPVNAIYPRDSGDDGDFDDPGELVYDSEVFCERPLSEVSESSVQVYAPALKEWPANVHSIRREKLDVFEMTH